jgi:hypothetical protein
MSSAKQPQNGNGARGAQARSGAAANAPAWAHGLKQFYDSVLDEPLPDSFKDLLDAFDERDESGEDAGTGKPA